MAGIGTCNTLLAPAAVFTLTETSGVLTLNNGAKLSNTTRVDSLTTDDGTHTDGGALPPPTADD